MARSKDRTEGREEEDEIKRRRGGSEKRKRQRKKRGYCRAEDTFECKKKKLLQNKKLKKNYVQQKLEANINATISAEER